MHIIAKRRKIVFSIIQVPKLAASRRPKRILQLTTCWSDLSFFFNFSIHCIEARDFYTFLVMFFRPELQIAVQSGKYHIVFKYTFIILFKNQCFTMILERKKHQLKFFKKYFFKQLYSDTCFLNVFCYDGQWSSWRSVWRSVHVRNSCGQHPNILKHCVLKIFLRVFKVSIVFS